MKRIILIASVLAVVMAVVALSLKPLVLWLHITRSSKNHPQELSSAKLFCKQILTNDTPSAEWIISVDDRNHLNDKTNYFYYIKLRIRMINIIKRLVYLMIFSSFLGASFIAIDMDIFQLSIYRIFLLLITLNGFVMLPKKHT